MCGNEFSEYSDDITETGTEDFAEITEPVYRSGMTQKFDIILDIVKTHTEMEWEG